jgi:hypothetical protein
VHYHLRHVDQDLGALTSSSGGAQEEAVRLLDPSSAARMLNVAFSYSSTTLNCDYRPASGSTFPGEHCWHVLPPVR